MRVFALGLSHKTAPIAVREKAAFTRAELPHALQTLNGALDNAVILSTCNRTELYAVAPEADGVRESFTSLLSRKTSLAEEELSGTWPSTSRNTLSGTSSKSRRAWTP